MTQHFLTPKNPEIADVILIGHDRMLDTFFAQVYKNSGDEPAWVLWKGCTRRELPYVSQVLHLVRDHAHIPDELWDALDHDRSRASYCTSQEANAVTHWSATGRIEPEHKADGAHA
jgi:hypothetical protein